MIIEPATISDLSDVRRLLDGHGLPLDGVAEHVDTMIVARDSGRLAGVAALEIYADGALLRSVAVASQTQGRRLGHQLTERALSMAAAHGVDTVFLLTTTAQSFFARFGFETITRQDVPASVQTSIEFRSACPASAVVMRRHGPACQRFGVVVRLAEDRDRDAVARIYNQGIEERIATFETRLRSAEEVGRWWQGRHPVVVAELEGAVAGFASTSGYRDRECYAGIAEFSVYVDREARGRGAGLALLNALFLAAADRGFHKLVSRIFVENTPSRRLAAAAGFREVGVYIRHGRLDGVWRDVVIVERLLP